MSKLLSDFSSKTYLAAIGPEGTSIAVNGDLGCTEWANKNKQISNYHHFKGFLYIFFKISAFFSILTEGDRVEK